jgi:RimJ/RimL family protein N-acetyltransferase
VRLEPLADRHVPDLWDVATPEIMRYMPAYLPPRPEEWGAAHFAAAVRTLIAKPDVVPFAVVERASGRAVGSTTYLDIRLHDRGLEIGNTWYGEAYQGTLINPAAKLLLLRHAFETLAAVRVQLKTDGRNLRSQRGIAKLGATLEGVLRKHVILPDGYIRDTVMYSILDDEWPAVRARLEERIQRP